MSDVCLALYVYLADFLNWVGSGSISRYRSQLYVCLFFLIYLLTVRLKNMLTIDISMRNGGVWRHMGAHGFVTNAYKCMQIHTAAYGCIQSARH